MTGLKDPGITPATWENYRQVLADGDLSVRVFALWRPPGSVEETTAFIEEKGATTRPYESRPDDRLISGGVKLYADGSGGARTAWLYEPWNRERTGVDEGNFGYPATDPDLLRTQIKMLHAAGVHVSVHSIGDRAIDWTLDSFAEALDEHPTSGLRHGIIHANIPTDRAIELMAGLQASFDAAYPEPSPQFTWWIGDTYAGNFGPDRSARLNPFRTYSGERSPLGVGLRLHGDPLPRTSGRLVQRRPGDRAGSVRPHAFGTAESVDAETALRAQTAWAAHQMFLDDQIGTIEVGKYGDLAVWDRDPLSVPTAELRDMACQATVFNGRVVYEAGS